MTAPKSSAELLRRTAADVLDKAAALIAERGWWEGNEESRDDRRLCAWQAIEVATQDMDPTNKISMYDVTKIFAQYLSLSQMHSSKDFYSITEWNDSPDRTPEQVIGKLREVATLERAL